MSKPEDYMIEALDNILFDNNMDLNNFSYLFDDPSKYKVKQTLPKRVNSTVKFIQYKDVPYEMALKEMDETREVQQEQEIDISPRISKIIGKKYGKDNYPEKLLKYYGEETLTKNISKKLDGDFSKCAGRSEGACEIDGKVLESGKPRVNILAKEYNQLISNIKKLHDAGIAHRDIKFDNIFREKDKLYLSDYDKACRNIKFKEKEYFDLIPACDRNQEGKAVTPLKYMPKQFYIDLFKNRIFYYLDEYDLYQLAITMYEIIMKKSYLNNDIFKINDPSFIQQNDNTKKYFFDSLYNNSYEILKTDMKNLLNEIDLDEDKDLLKFIIDYANPDFKYTPNRYPIPQALPAPVNPAPGNQQCNRNDKKGSISDSCYETKSKKTGENIILPSYCDRIIFNYDSKTLIESITPIDYNSLYFEDSKFDSDHNLVYSRMRVDFQNYGSKNKIILSRRQQPYLNLIYLTLNQGDGIGNTSTSEQLKPLYELFNEQDVIIIGLQEIQPQTKLDYISSQKDVPFINTISKDLQGYKLIFSKIYGMAKRRTGLFVFVKDYLDITSISKAEKCLYTRPEKLCNKSFIGTTLKVKTNQKDDLFINAYDTHLSFTQNKKDLGFSTRKEQLKNIVGIMIENSKNQDNYINILGGDLNFRVTDIKDAKPENIVTYLANQVSKSRKFKEPIQGKVYAFPPSCKFKTRKSTGKQVYKKAKGVEEKATGEKATGTEYQAINLEDESPVYQSPVYRPINTIKNIQVMEPKNNNYSYFQ